MPCHAHQAQGEHFPEAGMAEEAQRPQAHHSAGMPQKIQL